MGDGVAAEGTLPASAAAHWCGSPRHATCLHKHIKMFLSLVSFLFPLPAPSAAAYLDLRRGGSPGTPEDSRPLEGLTAMLARERPL